ncbi:Homoserine kinase [Stackebrandtia soli]
MRVPATSANLGAGFDSLGLALSLYDEVSARFADETTVAIEGEGSGTLPRDGSHLIVSSMWTAWREWGEPVRPVALRCVNVIPQARGLGSSSAAIVAGVVLASALSGRSTPNTESLRLAAAIEGHPDNVAPCLLGGFTIAWSNGDAWAVRVPTADGVVPVVYVPDLRGLTAHARAALPGRVLHTDAAFNLARSALMVHAMSSDPDLLFEATDDRLHQQYRASTMPRSVEAVATLRSRDIPAAISGAGPSVLAFTDAPPLLDGFTAHTVSVANGAALI